MTVQEPLYDKLNEKKTNSFPRIYIMLIPILIPVARNILSQIQIRQHIKNIDQLYTKIAILKLIRISIDLNKSSSTRIRDGFKLLLITTGVKKSELVKILKQNSLLIRHGVLQPVPSNRQLLYKIVELIKAIKL